jgi:hypothetical protein
MSTINDKASSSTATTQTKTKAAAGGETTTTTTAAAPTTVEAGNLSRAWRSLVSSVIVTKRSAEKLSSNSDPQQQQNSKKEFEEATKQTVRAREELRRCITALESQILRQVTETAELSAMLLCQPKVAGQKRKRFEG